MKKNFGHLGVMDAVFKTPPTGGRADQLSNGQRTTSHHVALLLGLPLKGENKIEEEGINALKLLRMSEELHLEWQPTTAEGALLNEDTHISRYYSARDAAEANLRMDDGVDEDNCGLDDRGTQGQKDSASQIVSTSRPFSPTQQQRSQVNYLTVRSLAVP